MIARCAVAVAVVAAVGATAFAQSKRYPKPPVDTDRAREQHSDLWDATLHPQKGPYKDKLDEARRKLDQRSDDERKAAIQDLTDAIAKEPDEPDAYHLRGDAYLALHEWTLCADDLAAAVLHAHRNDGLATELRRDLGVCQGRAGRLSDAEHTLADAAANGTRNVELWLRLGETRIAMGKLEEAQSALDTALDMTEGSQQTPILWLRAIALDRARRPSAAEDDVRRALGFDRTRSMIESPPLPQLGDGEHEYALALSYADAEPREPELAIVYFRRFLELAPKSPWRKRAEEHLSDLEKTDLPVAIRRVGGSAALDMEVAAKDVRAAMPKLRACLAHMPGVLVEVKITRAGPRPPDNNPNLPHYTAPPDGAGVTPVVQFDATKADIDTATRCVQPIAEKMQLPAVVERGGYYIFTFDVIQ